MYAAYQIEDSDIVDSRFDSVKNVLQYDARTGVIYSAACIGINKHYCSVIDTTEVNDESDMSLMFKLMSYIHLEYKDRRLNTVVYDDEDRSKLQKFVTCGFTITARTVGTLDNTRFIERKGYTLTYQPKVKISTPSKIALKLEDFKQNRIIV